MPPQQRPAANHFLHLLGLQVNAIIEDARSRIQLIMGSADDIISSKLAAESSCFPHMGDGHHSLSTNLRLLLSVCASIAYIAIDS